MGYLGEEHEQLANSQRSRFVSWVGGLPFDRKVTVISLSVLVGISSAAIAWSGDASDRVYFCLRTPTAELRCKDKNNRPYRMTSWHWVQWQQEGQPDNIVFKNLVKASNPNKPVFAVRAFIEFAIAGWLLRHLQNDERKLMQFEEVAEKHSVVQAELQARTELEFSAHEYTIEIQKAEILAEVDIKIFQMEASEMLFEAETAGMSDDQKREYVDFLRRQKTPYLQGTQTLEGTINPNDKVEGQEMAVINPHQWFEETISYCSVLVFGGQDSGKTTLASHIIKAKKDRGDRIVILDPHAAKGQWNGLEVIGAGMDYQAIDDAFRWYYSECERRYKLLAREGEEAVKGLGRICVVTEELTNYAGRCKNSGGYLQAAMSDNRKIFLDSLAISHNRTLSKLGGGKEIAQLRDDALLEIKLIPPSLNKPRQAFIKLPGQEFEPILLPNWETIKDFGISTSQPTFNQETLQRIWELEFNLDSETLKRPDETVKRPESNDYSLQDKHFTRFNLTRNDAKAEIIRLRNEMNLNQTEIIRILWGAKPGSSESYRNAVSEYKELVDGQNGE